LSAFTKSAIDSLKVRLFLSAFIWRCRDNGRTHPQVTDLVYIAAFAPDKENPVVTIANPPPGAPVPPSCLAG
jgi:hypothetical protein